MANRIETTRPLLLVLAVALGLTGCAGQKPVPEPPVELPGQFSVSGDVQMENRWWRAFEDPRLDQLMDRALTDNLDLRASFQRLRQARAAADSQASGLFPSVDGNAGAERQETDSSGSDTFSAGLSASYEVDLWGRIQSQVQAEEYRVQATRAEYQAAAVSLTGEIANAWFQLVEQQGQQALARRQLETNENLLSLIEARFAAGQGGSADVLRQRQLVASSRDRLNSIGAEIRILENQLSVLLGRSPGQAGLPVSDTLPELPVLPDTGVPGELVRRRPDVEQAWRQVQAADEDLAAAISNRFPRLTLDASLRDSAEDVSNLFDNWLATLAANLTVPLVDGGQRRAEVRRSRAVLEQRVQSYGQTVLTALQEVEDALAREQQQKRTLASLAEQIRLAEASYRQLRTQYLNGAVSYIEVLNALQDQQDLRREQLSTRQQLLGYRVSLYRALAGGLEVPGTESERPTPTTENDEA